VTASAEAAVLESELRVLGTPQRAASEQAYLKSDLEFTGTAVPVTRSVIRSWCRARPGLTRRELVAVARALWARPVFECRMAAVELLDARAALLRAGDAVLIEHMLRTARTWALVDGLAEHVMGALTERCPELAATLDRWARDDDFWLRRSAMLALLRPLRRGEGDFERFSRYADQMLEEKEFFIRKSIGWVLRDTAKRRPEMVAAWLAPRAHRASGVTLREAVKPLPADVRERLLAAHALSAAHSIPPARGSLPGQRGRGQPRQPGALPGHMRLVGVAGLGGQASQVDRGPGRVDPGQEPPEPEHPAHHPRPVADRGLAPAPELTLADSQLLGEQVRALPRTAQPPRHLENEPVRRTLRHQAGGDSRQPPQRLRGGQRPRQPPPGYHGQVGGVHPQVEQLAERQAQRGAPGAGPEPHPDHHGPRRQPRRVRAGVRARHVGAHVALPDQVGARVGQDGRLPALVRVRDRDPHAVQLVPEPGGRRELTVPGRPVHRPSLSPRGTGDDQARLVGEDDRLHPVP
jgi:3-methyladenine DNA glycosylase AlkD